MNSKSTFSIGQIIRKLRSKEFNSVYALYGGEAYFEDFFIRELSSSFLNKNETRKRFSLDLDSEEKMFRELSSISLFEEKSLIIVREIKKMRSQSSRKEFLQYLKSPNTNNILVIVSTDYDLKNSFLKKISESSAFIDIRTPFKTKMKEWILSFIKNRKINISNMAIEYYIENYGDSVSAVVNEIEKASILNGDMEINELSIDKMQGVNRTYNIWDIQDSLGRKDLTKSLGIGRSLIQNGAKLPQILVNLVNLYQQMLWKKMSNYTPKGYTGIGKMVTSNLSKYNKIYSKAEVDSIIGELSKLDVLSKSTSLNDLALFETLIVRICRK